MFQRSTRKRGRRAAVSPDRICSASIRVVPAPPSPRCYRVRFPKTPPSPPRTYTHVHTAARHVSSTTRIPTITIFFLFFSFFRVRARIELDWFSNDFNSFDREFKQVIAEKIVLSNDKIRLRNSFFLFFFFFLNDSSIVVIIFHYFSSERIKCFIYGNNVFFWIVLLYTKVYI